LQRNAQLLMSHGLLMQAHAGQMMLALQASRAEVANLAFAVQQVPPESVLAHSQGQHK
jgi:hypothetical protein